ncbi:MAG: ATP-binding cassette domain-containing protein, partial [Pseudomonadota bacterium]
MLKPVPTPQQSPVFEPRSSALAVSDLHKSYGAVQVLKGVSMDAREGDVISIIGASGSGKSTFLRCMNLLELPSSGSIAIAGEQVKFSDPKGGEMHPADKRQVQRLRTDLGMVFQGFNLWSHRTVIENVMEAPLHVLKLSKAEARERAERT